MDDELEGLKVVFEANLDDLNGTPGQMDSIFGAVESSAAAASDAITSSVQGVAHSFDALEISGDNLSEHLAKIQPFDASRSISDVEAAQAKLQLIQSDVDKAREHLQKLQNSANAGESVTGIPEAEAKLTLLERKAQDARENVQKLAQEEQEAGSSAESFASSENEAASSAGNLANKASEAGESVGGGFLSKIQGAIGGLFDFGSKIGMTIFGLQQIGQTATSVASSLLGPAASAEQLQGSLEVFTGSAQKAKQEMQDLNIAASHSPFKTTDVDQFALKLQSVGIAAQDVIPDFQALGDGLDAIGKTSEANLSQLTDAFIKIQTEGHLTTDTMNSFADMGIDAWSVLEKQTGKTHEALQAYISQGLYGAKDAMRDLTQGMEENPLYHGQMANDASVFNGVLSTLQSNWNQLLVGFGSPIIKALEPLLANVSNALSSQGFEDFAGGVGQKIVDVFGQIGSVLGPVIAGFSHLGGSAQIAHSEFGPFIDQAEHIASMLGGQFTDAFKFANTEVLQIATWAQNSGVLKDIGQEFQNLGHVVLDLGEIFVKGRGVIQDVEEHVFEKFAPIIERIIPPIVKFATTIDTDVTQAFHEATPYIEQAETAIGQFADGVIDRVEPIVEHWMPYLEEGAKELKQGWDEVFPYLKIIVETAFTEIQGNVQTAWSTVSGIINVGLDLLNGDWKQGWKDMQDSMKGSLEGIETQFKPLLEGLSHIPGPAGDMARSVLHAFDDMNGGSQQKTLEMKKNTVDQAMQTETQTVEKYDKMRQEIIQKLSQTKDEGEKKSLELQLTQVTHAENTAKDVVQKHTDMKNQVISQLDQFKQNASNVWNNISKGVQDIVGDGTKWIQDRWHDATQFIVDKFDWLYNHNYYFKDLVDTIKKDVQHGKEWLFGKWDEIKNDVVHKWDEIKGDGSRKSQELWDGISGPFRNAWGYVSGPLDSFGNNLRNTIGGWAGDAYNWGKNLIQGFINGIEGMVGNAQNAANDIMHSVAGILGFHSPAREGEGRELMSWGPNLVKGFSQGMESAIPQLQSSLNLVMKPVASTLSTAPVQASGLATFAQPLQGNSGGGNVTHVHIHIGEQEIASFLIDPLMDKVVKRLRLQGGRMVAV